MNLRNIIVHHIDKKIGEDAQLHLRDSVLPITNILEEFTKSVREAYYKKSNPIWGVFDDNTTSYPYQTVLRNYLDSNIDFYEYSVTSTRRLFDIINAIPQATGGYIVFAHFDENSEFVMTLMLNNKKQYNIDDSELLIKQIKSLDIDKLDVANFVNIDRWDSLESTYLSFAKGRKNVSDYFLKFIGCTDNISSKEQSSRLKRAVLDYLDQLDISDEDKEDKRNEIWSYCETQINRNENISLNHISSIFDSENPNAFSEFSSTEEYQVNSIIKGHKSTLKNLKYYIYRSSELTIEFDSELLINNRVIYRQADNQLIINEVPLKLRNQILNITNNSQEND